MASNGVAHDILELSRLIGKAEGRRGCPCLCHRGREVYHVMPCHPHGYEAPKTMCGGFGANPA